MAANDTVRQAKDAGGTNFNLAVQDKDGTGASLAPIHALRSAGGTTINPATEEAVEAIPGTAITDAAMPAGGAGLSGWLSAIWKAVTGAQPAGENHLGEVGGNYAVVPVNFTRPANVTAYASGQLVANSTSAGAVVPMQLSVARKDAGTGRIPRVRLSKSGNGLTNASFRVHLYKTLPTPSNGDGGAWLTDQSLNYLGSFDVTMDKSFTDGAKGVGTPNAGTSIIFDAAGGSKVLYALVEARAAYTPLSAEVFTVAVEVERN